MPISSERMQELVIAIILGRDIEPANEREVLVIRRMQAEIKAAMADATLIEIPSEFPEAI